MGRKARFEETMKERDPQLKKDEKRQIVPEPQDERMFTWLESLFQISRREAGDEPPRDSLDHKPKAASDSFPEKIELRATFGRGARGVSRPIMHKDWKPMYEKQPSREDLVQLANEFYGRAQSDCNGLRHQQGYGLFAYSKLKAGDYYERYLFSMAPTVHEYADRELPASDDEDSHRDRLMAESLQHYRWQQEHYTEAVSGILQMQQNIIHEQRTEIQQMYAERREMIIAVEESLSRKQERDERAEMAKLKQQAIAWGMGQVQSLLPAVKIYLSKGKTGVTDGLKEFFDGLTTEQKTELFGTYDAQGNCTQLGVLAKDQVDLFGAIVDGAAPGERILEFITSLSNEQMVGAQRVLRPDQIQTLLAMAKAMNDVVTKRNGNGA